MTVEEMADIVNDIVAEARAEAIKEFADKLIEVGTQDGAYGYVGVLEIERTAKEIVGADK